MVTPDYSHNTDFDYVKLGCINLVGVVWVVVEKVELTWVRPDWNGIATYVINLFRLTSSYFTILIFQKIRIKF